MKIEIKQENYKELVQCIFLGNLVVNGYRKNNETKKEYSDFVDGILSQIINSVPQKEPNYKFEKMPNKKTDECRLSDLCDKIDNSVKNFYEEFCNSVFCEKLADIIADRNYPIINAQDAFDNLLAKNLYYEILKNGNENFAIIYAPKIGDKLKARKREAE